MFHYNPGVRYEVLVDDRAVLSTMSAGRSPVTDAVKSNISQLLTGKAKAIHIKGDDGSYLMVSVMDLTPPEAKGDVNLTEAQINFFEVEIRNELEVLPDSGADLNSAFDSIWQAPREVVIEWCNSDTVKDYQGVQEFTESIQELQTKFGGNTKLRDLLQLHLKQQGAC